MGSSQQAFRFGVLDGMELSATSIRAVDSGGSAPQHPWSLVTRQYARTSLSAQY